MRGGGGGGAGTSEHYTFHCWCLIIFYWSLALILRGPWGLDPQNPLGNHVCNPHVVTSFRFECENFFFFPIMTTGYPPQAFPLPRVCVWIAVGRSKSFRRALRVFEWVCPRLWSHAAGDGRVQGWPSAVWRITARQIEDVQRHRKRLGRIL